MVSDVVPKTFYNSTKKSYAVSVTVCVEVARLGSTLLVEISAEAPDIGGSLKGVSRLGERNEMHVSIQVGM